MISLWFIGLAIFCHTFGFGIAIPVEGGYIKMKEEKAIIMKECNESNPITSEFLESLNKTGKFPVEDDSSRFPMCFVHCLFDKNKLIDEDGVLNPEGLEEAFKSMSSKEMPDMREMVDKCIEEQTVKDVCEKAYGFLKCLLTEPMNRFSTAEDQQDDINLADSKEMIATRNETVETIKRTMNDVGSTILSILRALTSFQRLFEILSSAMG